MKVKIILIIFLNAVLLNAQTFEKDWNVIEKKWEAGTKISLSELEGIATGYKKDLSKFPDYSTQLFSLIASDYYNQGKYKKAEDNYFTSLSYAKNAADTSLKHIVEYYLAVYYHELNNYIEAEKYYVKCMAGMAAVYGQSSREYTQIFYNYTGLLVSMEKYQQAQPYIDALMYYYKTLDGEKSEKYTSLLNYQAIIYQNLGEYVKAIEILKRITTEQLLISYGDTTSHVVLESNLGDVYRESGKFDLAITYLKKAKQDFYGYKVKNRGVLASIENNLGLCYKAIGSIKEAEEAYNTTLSIYKDIGETNTEGYCTTLSNKADLYRELGRLGEASELLLTALNIRKQRFGTNTENYANALSNLAIVYFDAGYYKEALEKNLEANEIYKNVIGEMHQGFANSLNNLSLCYLQLKEYKKAEEYKSKALVIIEKTVGKNHYRYASYLISTCGLYRKTNQFDKAEVNLKEALNLVERNFGKKHDLYAHAQLLLAELYATQAKYEQATPLYFNCLDYYSQLLNGYFDAMDEEDQANYLSFITPVFESYNIFLLNYKLSQPKKDFSEHIRRSFRYQLIVKSLLTNKSARVKREIAASGDKELVDLYSKWVSIKNDLINNFKSVNPATENNELVFKAADLEKALKAKLKKFGQNETIDYEIIKSSLLDGEAALEIFKTSEWVNDSVAKVKYAALVVRKDLKNPDLVILTDGNRMDNKAFENYSKCVDEQLDDTLSYGVYFSSFENALKGIRKVFVSADGVYQKINLSGIYNPRDKKFVNDEYEIYYTPNIASISGQDKNVKKGTPTAVLFGYPDYDFDFKKNKDVSNKQTTEMVAKRFGLSNLAKLPGTKTEVEEIERTLKEKNWKPEVYMNELASEANLRKVNSPRILHIATHGFYLKDIETDDKTFLGFESSALRENSFLRSGVILAGAGPATTDTSYTDSENDGIVTAFETSFLNLSNTELVVLSACQTGLGDEMGSQGVAGLRCSLTIAGAKNIIMSLWPVDDDATKTLMTEFYRNYAATENVDDSFKKARLVVKEKFKHPYYWAAFILLKTFN